MNRPDQSASSETEESDNEQFSTPPITPIRPVALQRLQRHIKTTKMQVPPEKEKTSEATVTERQQSSFDLQTYYKGYKKLEQRVKELEGNQIEANTLKRIEQLEKQKAGLQEEEVRSLQLKIDKISAQQSYYMKHQSTQAGTIQRLHQILDNTISKIETLEIDKAKSMVMISGLEIDTTDKKEMLNEIEAFLEVELNIRVQIDDAYKIGTKNPKQIVVVFQNQRDKGAVLERKSNLEGTFNRFKQQYYINDYLTAKVNERRRREREIKKWNKQAPEELKANIEFDKGKFKINGMEYKKLIREPRPEDILDLEEEHFDRIMKLKIDQGKEILDEGSTFIPYTAAVQCVQEIQDFYVKVRILHPKARHIVCAYSIPSNNIYTGIDGCDDDEIGATKAIVNAMKEEEITHRLFLIVRYCGPTKLYAKRFEHYYQAAKIVLDENPTNKITGQGQMLLEFIRKPVMKKPLNKNKQLQQSGNQVRCNGKYNENKTGNNHYRQNQQQNPQRSAKKSGIYPPGYNNRRRSPPNQTYTSKQRRIAEKYTQWNNIPTTDQENTEESEMETAEKSQQEEDWSGDDDGSWTNRAGLNDDHSLNG